MHNRITNVVLSGNPQAGTEGFEAMTVSLKICINSILAVF